SFVNSRLFSVHIIPSDMANSLYITTAESYCGKSLLDLGIIDYVLRRTQRVSFFRPIISAEPGKRDKNIELILGHFNLDQEYEEAYVFHQKEAKALISAGKTEKLLDKIIKQYKALEAKSDFILCEGTDFLTESSAFEFGINVEVAKNIGSPVLIVGRGDKGRTVEEVISTMRLAIESFHEEDYDVMGAIVNRVDQSIIKPLVEAMKKELPDGLFLSAIPTNDLLRSPTVREICTHLDADVLYGSDQLDTQVYSYSVAAMQLHNYLDKVKERSVVITPGDRGEIILGTLAAHQSQNAPQVSAIILTTGLQPDDSIKNLLDGVPDIIPILSVKDNTFETATKLGNIQSYINTDNTAKIDESLRLFNEHIDAKALEEITSKVVARGTTPRMFQFLLTQRAKSNKKHIVLPEGEDERILKAAELLLAEDVVELSLLGKKTDIENQIKRLGLNLSEDNINIIEPEQSKHFQNYVEALYELRKEKGMTMERAHDSMLDVSYFGTMMVYKGHADGMVSGAVHTTQHTIRPALQFVKTKPGCPVVSSLFFMCLDDRVLAYADCAIITNPTAEELSEIALSTVETVTSFGIEPKVAMLSYSSGSSGKGAEVEKVRTATELVKGRDASIKIEGPIQYDAAVDLGVGQKKMPGSEVAGKASVLIFPDLNTGNNTYKAVQRETGAVAIGPVLQGLNKPVNDLSRGCTVADIVNTVIITAIQAAD
ncbi:MAG: phosphate acetyltransferase, partial [Bacteroidota bacterium]